MTTQQKPLWDRFLSPIVRSLINEDEMRQFQQSVDWQTECDRLGDSTLTYPEYYRNGDFHGIKGGYLTSGAAVSYDPITQYVLPPGESWVRQSLIDAIGGKPRRILDLGCGTGSTTLTLKRAFPQAEVIGLDLSPYMLFMGEYKARQAGLEIQWRHGNAESTGFPEASFDVVTMALLFHETPPAVSQAILRECYRLLVPGGEVLMLDGNQRTLNSTDWLTEVFQEPYIKEYSAGSVEAWMGRAGFEAVRTQEFWWMHQVTRGIKPLPTSAPTSQAQTTVSEVSQPDLAGIPAPAFSTAHGS